jgi:small-conductance mechanosensitive channel
MDDFWQEVLFRIGAFTFTTAKLAEIVGVFFFIWMLLFIFRKSFLNNTKLSPSEKGARASLYQLVKYLGWVIAISVGIKILGFNVTLLVAGSAALMVGLGFGLQNIFSDIISGLFMLFERKVKVGDIMEVDSIVGKLQTINLRASVLLTRDGYNIIVPNHKFITENVINWTHQAFDRRFHLEVGVGYDSDIDLVTAVLTKCAIGQKEVLKAEEHKPFVRLEEFGDSSLVFHLIFWTEDIFRVEQVKSELRYKIFKAFRENAIALPFPQRDIHIIQPKA